jgi:hypothetical protein
MKTLLRAAAIAGILTLTFVTSSALAHARLVSAIPANGAVTASPQMIMLTFNEKLTATLSGFAVTGPDGKPVSVQVSVAGGGTMLHAMPQKPLAPGKYAVAWHAVTADGHRTEGTVTFTVQ